MFGFGGAKSEGAVSIAVEERVGNGGAIAPGLESCPKGPETVREERPESRVSITGRMKVGTDSDFEILPEGHGLQRSTLPRAS